MNLYNIAIINGPNLNLLGTREPSIYGGKSLSDVISYLESLELCQLSHFQSNSESDIVNYIQTCHDKQDFIIINAAAYTHTSIAIRDALLTISIPFYELHISNIFKRESFRHHSYLSDKAEGIISGFGTKGYELAILGAINYLENKNSIIFHI